MASLPELDTIPPTRRFRRLYLLNGATGLVWWALLGLLITLSIFASSVTRFAPGDPLPELRLASVVVPDPERAGGEVLAVRGDEFAAFHRAHPGAHLAPPPTIGDVLLKERGTRKRHTMRVVYSAFERPGGVIEVTVRSSMPFSDSPGSFGYLVWRYQVLGDRIEPQLMLEFDPFLTGLLAVVGGFFFSALFGGLAEQWLIKRPMARRRWWFVPPFNRDWLVTRGIPLRFEAAPPTLDALVAALQADGAKVHYQADQGALRARYGRLATLTANRREAIPVIDLVIDGGLAPLATLLLVLVAPLAALFGAGTLGFWLLDPFSSLADSGPRALLALALAVVAALWARAFLRRDGLIQQADRLGEVALATLARQGALAVVPTLWPDLIPPLGKWQRRRPWLLLAVAVLLVVISIVVQS